MSKCWDCNGKGGYEQVDHGDDSGNTHWDICPRCNGTGVEPEDTEVDW